MSKYLTPWYPQYFHPEYPHQYVRLNVGGEYEEFMVRGVSDKGKIIHWVDDFGKGHGTAQEAMDASDKILTNREYVFLTKEQVEKFQVLV